MRSFHHTGGLLLLSALVTAGFYACSDNPTSSSPTPVFSGSHVYVGPGQDTGMVSFDFGYSPQYALISHIFWLHNATDDSLEIIDLRPG